MKLLLFLGLFFSLSVKAEFVTCKSGIGQYGNLSEMRYQIGYFKAADKCFVSVGPRNKYPEYRSFSFDSSGELMVFNSLGAGRPSQDTGARNFFFPEGGSELEYELDRENEFIRIKNIDGRVWEFDARSAKIVSIDDMNFVEDPDISRTNNGGLELTPTKGALIDEGWRLGGPPNIVLNRSSTIMNFSGEECMVKNKKLFKHRLDNRGRVDGAYFIHNSSAKWKKFLKKSCSHFGL